MKKKLLIITFILYIVIALIATKALLDRNEYGVYVTKSNYYICNGIIKEYDESSLVRFAKNVDYEKMVEEDIYYFNKDNELKVDKLVDYDKDTEKLNINGDVYDKEVVLGRPDKAYQIVGSLLNIITSRAFYLIFVIIPILGLFIYEIYLLVQYMAQNKAGKDKDNDKETKKKDK